MTMSVSYLANFDSHGVKASNGGGVTCIFAGIESEFFHLAPHSQQFRMNVYLPFTSQYIIIVTDCYIAVVRW